MPAKRDRTCPDCSKSFSRAHDVKRHRLTHTKPAHKMFACPFGCGHSTLQKPNMRQHVVAIHWKLKLHVCRFNNCGSAFSDPSSLKRHQTKRHPNFRKAGKKAASHPTVTGLDAATIDAMISAYNNTWGTLPASPSSSPPAHNATLPIVARTPVTSSATSSSHDPFWLPTSQRASPAPSVAHGAPHHNHNVPMVQSVQSSIMAPGESTPSYQLPVMGTGTYGLPYLNYRQPAHLQTNYELMNGAHYHFDPQLAGNSQLSSEQQFAHSQQFASQPQFGMHRQYTTGEQFSSNSQFSMIPQFPSNSQTQFSMTSQVPIDPQLYGL